jgi:hypothetical protein
VVRYSSGDVLKAEDVATRVLQEAGQQRRRRARLLFLGVVTTALLVFLGWTSLSVNVARAEALRSVLAGHSATITQTRVLAEGTSQTSRDLLLAALDTIGTQGDMAMPQAEIWLGRAFAAEDPIGQQTLAISLAGQSARWIQQYRPDRAQLAFELLQRLASPAPEPYFRIGEAGYVAGRNPGVPYVDAFELAASAPASTRRDAAFQAMAQIRLCEHALRAQGDGARAEALCHAGLAIDADPAYMSGFVEAGEMLLDEALQKQRQGALVGRSVRS